MLHMDQLVPGGIRMSILVSEEQSVTSDGASIGERLCAGTNSTLPADASSQLREIFADLSSFEVGELSRLCISKDYF